MADDGIALILAAREGNLAEVRRLLDRGVDIESRSTPGKTPLMEACRYGHAEVARELMHRGARLRFENDNRWGNCPLTLCLWPEHLDLAHEVIDYRLREDSPAEGFWPISDAALYGYLDLVRRMVGVGVSVNGSGKFQRPLHSAVASGSLEVARWLLESGADPNLTARATRKYEQTALDVAYDRRSRASVELLRAHGGQTGEELGLLPPLRFGKHGPYPPTEIDDA